MLPFYLKRLFWLVPTLIAVSLIGFYVLSLAPLDPSNDGMTGEEAAEARRARFLELPLFLNLHPVDVRVRAKAAAMAVADGGEGSPDAERELLHLGAAALPHVIPSLDGFSPDERTRIAIALAPVAVRMHLPDSDRAKAPATAVTFWLRYWDDRGEELQEGKVRSAVDRLARYRTSGRAAEVEELDTFALDEVMRRLSLPVTDDDVPGVRALSLVLSHVTERDDRIPEGATLDDARAAVRRWKAYWFVHSSDFVTLDGTARASALVLETRYGKWASSIANSFTADGPSPALLRVAEGGRATLSVLLPALALAYVLGMGLGLVQAARLRRPLDRAIGGLLLLLYAIPPAALSVASVRLLDGASPIRPIVVVAAGIILAPALHQRSGLATVASADFVRAAKARGAGPLRVYVVHVMRFALLPLVSMAPIEIPSALGIAFVAERAFGLRGLGDMTTFAVRSHDVDFLMTLALCLATVAALLLVATDLAHASLDPRMRHRLTRGRG